MIGKKPCPQCPYPDPKQPALNLLQLDVRKPDKDAERLRTRAEVEHARIPQDSQGQKRSPEYGPPLHGKPCCTRYIRYNTQGPEGPHSYP